MIINRRLKQNNEQIGKNQTELHNELANMELANMEMNRRFLSLSRSEERVNLDTKFEDNLPNINKACLAGEQEKRSSRKDAQRFINLNIIKFNLIGIPSQPKNKNSNELDKKLSENKLKLGTNYQSNLRRTFNQEAVLHSSKKEHVTESREKKPNTRNLENNKISSSICIYDRNLILKTLKSNFLRNKSKYCKK
jgi:hypothetical protein